MQNATVREYTRGGNTVENIRSHSQSYRSVRPCYLRPRDRGNHKESAPCPITKASNSLHFHIPLFFLVFFFPSHAVSEIFFLFLIPFLIQEIFKNAFSVESLYHKDSNIFRPLVLGRVTKTNTPCCKKLFSFSPLPFPRRTAELSSLCNVVSSIYQHFVPYFGIVAFLCIYLHCPDYRINK